MNKKLICVLVCLFVFLGVSFAQTMTRFGVVDTARVYSTYFRDSAAVRNYEQKKAEFQKKINEKTEELKTLNQKMIDLKEKGDEAGALKVEAEITKKADYLSEFANTKNTELESIKRRIEKSDSFYSSLYDVIGRIAESEGYSMILSLQQANSILWYSPSVDITDKVISGLSSR
ncbi:MAG: OmpH family outer membrane protein [Treponemataceae bacterium]|jgi:outer membrane protein|nr:OmpH family outer membrane protein [Treponemataceae bacterium]